MALSIETAELILDGARAKASEMKVPMSFAVVDAGGYLIALVRMDGAGLLTPSIAHSKAYTAAVFRRARAEGYQITMHCDVDQENSVEHIRQGLEVIGVDRIDHGVNILESDELTAELRRRGLGLTVCPISNRWVTGELKAGQIKRMLDLGLRVTVNSDDPAYFAAYVTDNLIAAQQAAGLEPAELLQLERNAIEIAWLPAGVRDQLLAEIDRYEASAAS